LIVGNVNVSKYFYFFLAQCIINVLPLHFLMLKNLAMTPAIVTCFREKEWFDNFRKGVSKLEVRVRNIKTGVNGK